MKDAVNFSQHDDLDAFEKILVVFPRVFSDLAASPGEESSVLFFGFFCLFFKRLCTGSPKKFIKCRQVHGNKLMSGAVSPSC